MPTQKPRIALTVPDDLNELLDNLSELMGKPKSTFIVEFLIDAQPLFSSFTIQSIMLKKFKTVCRL